MRRQERKRESERYREGERERKGQREREGQRERGKEQGLSCAIACAPARPSTLTTTPLTSAILPQGALTESDISVLADGKLGLVVKLRRAIRALSLTAPQPRRPATREAMPPVEAAQEDRFVFGRKQWGTWFVKEQGRCYVK